MREGEAPLPDDIDILRHEERLLLSKFIATHRQEITLPTDQWPETYVWNYSELVYLLRLLHNNSLLYIIDFHRSFVIQTIKKLRGFNFGGPWFDSLQTILVDNVQNNHIYLENLKDQELKLRCEKNILCQVFQIENKTDLTSEAAHTRIKCFQQQTNELESQIANIMQQRKIIFDVRNSLNFFYPA
ncbi:hypothetical protein TSUD_44930 [Trifolium subterraneum]|nr:hypothetical protein TSUD_44930 [Trifolium subterraneum]